MGSKGVGDGKPGRDRSDDLEQVTHLRLACKALDGAADDFTLGCGCMFRHPADMTRNTGIPPALRGRCARSVGKALAALDEAKREPGVVIEADAPLHPPAGTIFELPDGKRVEEFIGDSDACAFGKRVK